MTPLQRKLLLLFAVSGAAFAAALLCPPLPQDPAYHAFADNRRILGVPNFWNVLTNAPFLLVGVIGIRLCYPQMPPGGLQDLRAGYLSFFAGILLTGLGSGYYHLDPTTTTLTLDRLPMAIAFMAFTSIAVGEHISTVAGRRLLIPLLLAGVASVGYWHVTELRGAGDLRAYGLVQFLPMLLIPMILLMFRSRLHGVGYLWMMSLAYLLAKFAEHFDAELFALTGVLSGHSCKHLLAAFGSFWLVLALKKRRRVSPELQNYRTTGVGGT